MTIAPGLLQSSHCGGVGLRDTVGIQQRTPRAADALGIEDLFHGEWDAVQRAEGVAVHNRPFRRARLIESRVVRKDDGVDDGVYGVNPVSVRLDDLNRRHILRPYSFCQLGGVREEELGGQI